MQYEVIGFLVMCMNIGFVKFVEVSELVVKFFEEFVVKEKEFVVVLKKVDVVLQEVIVSVIVVEKVKLQV